MMTSDIFLIRHFIIIFLFLFALFSNVMTNNRYIKKDCKITHEYEYSCTYIYNESQNFSSIQNNTKIIKTLNLKVGIANNQKDGIVHVTLKDSNNPRYEVPRYVLSEDFNLVSSTPSIEKIGNFDEENFVTIVDPISKQKLFNLFKNELVYLDDYISFDYELPSDYIFGYGERVAKFKLPKGLYTIWPNDTGGSFEDEGHGGKNLYGHQPFLMVKMPNTISRKNSYIGILFLNSNPQDLEIRDGGEVKQITLGGIVEIFAWLRPTPIETIKVLHHIIGKPTLPPYWAVGWHQSKYGFIDSDDMETVVNNYLKYEIPIDTLWADIDYMDRYQDFTVDSISFKNLPSLVKRIQNENGMHFVPIIDIGIFNDKNNTYYDIGVNSNAFIVSNYTSKPLVNKVWPGECVFPDFTNYENATKLWHTGLHDLKQNLNYDGIWLDMNEPGTFVDGEIVPEGKKDKTKNKYSDLTYIPGNKAITLDGHGISINARVFENEPFNDLLNYKPLIPFLQTKITNSYLKSINRRPFILSRSSYLGTGRYASHWLGDNFSTFQSMKNSISGIFNFQMFGFNLVGADICGFSGDATDTLCARWSTLGAFYPFSRNHNCYGSHPQEPWALGNLTLSSSTRAIKLRYSIIRYLYTQFYLSSKDGGVVFQPLFFQFTEINDLIDNEDTLNHQIMIGPALMFSPALNEDTEDYSSLFPYSNWNKFPSGEAFLTVRDFPDKYSAKSMMLSGSYDDINIFMRGGTIIPFQDVAKYKPLTTADLKNSPLNIIVNPDENEQASGDIIFDDSNSNPETAIKEKLYLHIRVQLRDLSSGLDFIIINKFSYSETDRKVERIIIFKNELMKKKKLTKIRFLSEERIVVDEPNYFTITYNPPKDIDTLNKVNLFE